MPVFAPGVAESRLLGLVGPNAFAVVLHWYSGSAGPWTQSQITALATSVESHAVTNLLPSFAQDVILHQVSAVDLSDATERAAETPLSNNNGTTVGTAPTLSACLMVSHKIASRYRGGHPRSYFPPSAGTQTPDGDNWNASIVSGFQTGFTNFHSGVLTDLAAGGLPNAVQCCPRYSYTYAADPTKHKFIRTRSAFLQAAPITSSVVSTAIRSQRRRLGK